MENTENNQEFEELMKNLLQTKKENKKARKSVIVQNVIAYGLIILPILWLIFPLFLMLSWNFGLAALFSLPKMSFLMSIAIIAFIRLLKTEFVMQNVLNLKGKLL